jgi:hypothetical protein
MKPLNPAPPANGRVMPSCTTARGRSETLMRGRDATTRFGPTATAARPTMRDAARTAAARGT